MKRKEDPRFIRGKGNYVDDIMLPGMLYMDIVRSPYAHAKILKIDTTEALKMPGVLAVITGETLAQYKLHWMPTLMSDTQMVLPTDKVMYQAQEVAAVIATDRYAAADGVAAVEVEYEPLPVVVDPFKALKPGAPVLRTDKEARRTTTSGTGRRATAPATDAGVRRTPRCRGQAAASTSRASTSPRSRPAAASPTSTRRPGKLTVYMTTQAPHAIRTVFALVAGHVGLSEEKIRIISPDIGGGFGGKVPVYPGYVIAVAASVVIGKPVKWIEDRMENLQADSFARDYHIDAELAADEGRHDHGAAHQDPGRPRLRRRRGQPVEVPGRPLLDLHRLLRHQGRLRRGRRRLHQQAAGRRRLPLLVPRHRGRARHRAHGRHPGRTSSAMDPADLRFKNFIPPGAVPLQVRARLGVRQRQLRGRAQEGDGDRSATPACARSRPRSASGAS